MERLGEAPPESGPVIFVANHPNGLVDPVVVGRMVERRLLFLAKAPIFKMPVLGWLAKRGGAIPVYRRMDGGDTGKNDEMFRAVYDALAQGEAICLFPEGISHNLSELQPLKTGAARMALGAEQSHDWSLGVKIVPVGLHYRSKTRFQSRVAVEFGQAIDASEFREAYQSDERLAVATFTAAIESGIREVTLNLEEWRDLALLRLAEQLLPQDGGHQVQRLRSFAAAGREIEAADPAALNRLRERLAVFQERLRASGLHVRHLDARYAPGTVLRFAGRNIVALLLGLPLAAVGAIAYFPPFLLVKLARKLAKPTEDIASTVKILAALVFFPLWHFALTALVGFQFGWNIAFVLFLTLPLAGFYARHFFRRRRRAWREIYVFFSFPFLGRQHRLLLREAQALRTDLLALEALRTQPSI